MPFTATEGHVALSTTLLDIANLNITHYQRQADLIHALHVAAMQTLVLEGWDDTSGTASMNVNYAIAMQPGNKAYYVQSDATSFDAQMSELQSLEAQMSTLGVTKLFGQKFVAESAEAKRIDQAQSNCTGHHQPRTRSALNKPLHWLESTSESSHRL